MNPQIQIKMFYGPAARLQHTAHRLGVWLVEFIMESLGDRISTGAGVRIETAVLTVDQTGLRRGFRALPSYGSFRKAPSVLNTSLLSEASLRLLASTDELENVL